MVRKGHESLLLACEEGAVDAVLVQGVIHLAGGEREKGKGGGGKGEKDTEKRKENQREGGGRKEMENGVLLRQA